MSDHVSTSPVGDGRAYHRGSDGEVDDVRLTSRFRVVVREHEQINTLDADTRLRGRREGREQCAGANPRVADREHALEAMRTLALV